MSFRALTVMMITAALTAGTVQSALADFDAEAHEAGRKIQAAFTDCADLIKIGDIAGANAKLLARFPEASRTSAEAFVLGNALFETDRTRSYALHRAAASAEPNQPEVQYEWALELHRAGEYEAAAKTYRAFSAARPGNGVPYMLLADCLLHLNRTDDAVAAADQAEAAPSGSIEGMEDMVCAVKRDPMPYPRRAELLAKVVAKNEVAAAEELIGLDCAFPDDWWNSRARPSYLEYDIPLVMGALKLPPDDTHALSIQCAAALAAGGDDADSDAIRTILNKHKLLVDAQHTLPTGGTLASYILHVAVLSKAVDADAVRKDLAAPSLAAARRGKDAEQWNTALYCNTGDDWTKNLALEKEAWAASGDVRFATGALFAKSRDGKLRSDDPILLEALKQFPDSGDIQRYAVAAAKQDNTLTRERLAAAAMAEFHHFSSFVAFATVVDRPRSDLLRGYLKAIKTLPAK